MNRFKLRKSVMILIAAFVALVYSASIVACLALKTADSPVLGPSTFSSDTAKLPANSSAASAVSRQELPSYISESSDEMQSGDMISGEASSTPEEEKPAEASGFTSAIWYSYYELDFRGLSADEFIAKVNTLFDDAVTLQSDAVICHVRPYADAFYPSDLFPMSEYVSGTQGEDPGYDPLEYMVIAAHARGLQFHAWINPYRIARSEDISLLADSSPAKKWRTDGNPDTDRNVISWGGGLYFNPARPEVRGLIIDGVREILRNYDVDGIHIDDYFYPTAPAVDEKFDGVEYEAYKASSTNYLSIDDWRRANVNALVSGIYSAVKSYDGVVFGVSPSYAISEDKSDDNYNFHYADVALWMNSDGYIDYVTPQLYFGYQYPTEWIRFDKLLALWTSIPRRSSVKLYIGLAAYKIGSPDAGSNEWQTDTEILAKQAYDAKNAGCDGIFIFSYSSMINNSPLNISQRDALMSMLDQMRKRG